MAQSDDATTSGATSTAVADVFPTHNVLPGPIKIRGVRVAVLVWSIALFGTLSVLTFRAQFERLFGG